MMPVKDLSGNRYGHILVLNLLPRKIVDGKLTEPNYHCVCDCGKEVDILGRVLRTGRRKTCGCGIGDKRKAKEKTGNTTAVMRGDSKVICQFRLFSCAYSMAGRCCCYCEFREECDDACLNTPEKCTK